MCVVADLLRGREATGEPHVLSALAFLHADLRLYRLPLNVAVSATREIVERADGEPQVGATVEGRAVIPLQSLPRQFIPDETRAAQAADRWCATPRRGLASAGRSR
jgi:hypothetical protein